MGTLYYGDNLDILRRYIKDETVDLVYLDPPFNSAQNYNAFFHEKDGTDAASQIHAFEDTWHWDIETKKAYDAITEQPGKVSDVMQAFYTFLGGNDMMAYLTMMSSRLVELRRVLKPTGSLYLHCDPTASHYLKLLLDAVMGQNNYRSEIIWKRTTTHSDSKRWSANNDTILFYSKTDEFTWNPPYAEHGEEYVADKYRFDDNDGRGAYTLDNMTSPNPRPNMMYEWKGHKWPDKGWRYSKETMAQLDAEGRIWYPEDKEKRPRLKRYLKEMSGTLMGTNWTDISPINSQARERLGYPTQKPIALLERIILASSNPGGLVLDPFCGCGTTIDAAEKNGRDWIGIDVTQLAISLIKNRLQDTYGSRMKFVSSSSRLESAHSSPSAGDQSGLTSAATGQENASLVRIIGEPTTPNEAATLAEQDKFQFQWWALGLVGARPVEQKKGADHGIDGKILFRDDPKAAKPEQIIIQVKGGKTGVKDVRDLRGVLDREKAAIGILISLQPPTGPMETEAASAGFYEHKTNQQKYPRLQLRTVKELMEGKGIERPTSAASLDDTFKKAPTSKRKSAEEQALPGM
jgi:site-specific DNA-methyltransferase (adenine-specific)